MSALRPIAAFCKVPHSPPGKNITQQMKVTPMIAEPMLAVRTDDVLHQQEDRGADGRPDQRAGAAEHGHDQNIAGRGPIDRVRRR